MFNEQYEMYRKCRCCANNFELAEREGTKITRGEMFLWRCMDCQKAGMRVPIPSVEWVANGQ